MIVPFVGPCYKGSHPYWDGQDTVNLFLDVDAAGGESRTVLRCTPGLTHWTTLASSGPVRGMIAGADGYLYAVCSSAVFKITASGVATSLGTVEVPDGPVSMATNGLEILIADGLYGYLLTLETGAFARIVDDNFPGAASVAFVDGYFAVLKPDSEQWFLSGLYDGATWDGLTWATAQGRPDKLKALAVSHREVWLFGEDSLEVWYDTGASPPTFPFDRISGAFLEVGCSAAASVAEMDNTVFWLTDKGQVARASGYVPQFVSTRQMEDLISGYARRDDAEAFTYGQGGHTYYVLTFPNAGVTWVYDAATDSWHRRQSFGLGRWRVSTVAPFAGKLIAGDSASGKLYELSHSALTEDGTTIERVRDTAPIVSDGKRLLMSSLTLDVQPGTATAIGQDPQAMLQWSDDGGRTWSNEYWASLGRVGEYEHRVIWRRLGSFRRRMFRLKITDPIDVLILGATAEISKGAS